MPKRLPAGRAGGRKGESKALRTGNEKHDEDEGGDCIPGPSQRPSSVHGGQIFPVMESGKDGVNAYTSIAGWLYVVGTKSKSQVNMVGSSSCVMILTQARICFRTTYARITPWFQDAGVDAKEHGPASLRFLALFSMTIQYNVFVDYFVSFIPLTNASAVDGELIVPACQSLIVSIVFSTRNLLVSP
jgi:hypothetical protein